MLVYANLGGTIFFIHAAFNDNFSWFVVIMCGICVFSNGLWCFLFRSLGRSAATQGIFVTAALLSFVSIFIHWRRPVVEDEDASYPTNLDPKIVETISKSVEKPSVIIRRSKRKD